MRVLKNVFLFLLPSLFCFGVLNIADCRFAKADTYQIVNLDSDQARLFYAMDDNGNVVLHLPGGCGFAIDDCYKTYHYGVLAAMTGFAPSMDSDSGVACTPPTLPGLAVYQTYARCNNGRYVYTALTPEFRGSVYTDQGILSGGGLGRVFINGNGDIVFDDVFSEYFFVAIDITNQAPEPQSIVLLSTGVLAVLGFWRKKRSGARSGVRATAAV